MTTTPTQPSAAAPSGAGQAATTTQSNLPIPPPGSRFDNKLFREIKLTEIPVFLWENSGWNGLFRFKIFLQKRMSSPCNPIAEYAIRWPLAILGFLMIPGLIGVYTKNTRTRDALIRAKYGDTFDKMTPIEQDYVRRQITQVLNTNR